MNSQLLHKLLHYEVQPPERVWDKIAASLDDTISLTISEKLFHFEEAPSPVVWQNISSHLDNSVTEKTKVVPFFTKYRRPLKYSGTVAIFIFLAVLSSLLISKKTESESPAEGVANTSIKNDTATTPDDSKESNAVSVLTEKNQTDHLVAKAKVSRVKKEESENSYSSFENFLPQEAERNEMVGTSVSSDKYMIYSDGDGNAIRLPKKIFNAFVCPTNDVGCKQRLQQLREKFAASAMTADFTGLLQILKSLQENQ